MLHAVPLSIGSRSSPRSRPGGPKDGQGLACGDGPLKPDVVFFGETVPRERVDRSFELVGGARCLLVLGSSLTVMSGYRFVLRAAKLGTPVGIVNLGPTRGDEKADVRLDAPLGLVLPELARRLAD